MTSPITSQTVTSIASARTARTAAQPINTPATPASGTYGADGFTRSYQLQGLFADAQNNKAAGAKADQSLTALQAATDALAAQIATLPQAAGQVSQQGAAALAAKVKTLAATVASSDAAAAAQLTALQTQLDQVASGKASLDLSTVTSLVGTAADTLSHDVQTAGATNNAIVSQLGGMVAVLQAQLTQVPAAAAASASKVSQAAGQVVKAAGAVAVNETRMVNQDGTTLGNLAVNTVTGLVGGGLLGALAGVALALMTASTPIGWIAGLATALGFAASWIGWGPNWFGTK